MSRSSACISIRLARVSPDAVQALLLGFARACACRGRVPAQLYASGIRYKREPLGREWWQEPIETFALRVGDCEDLVTYRLVELWSLGERARPKCYAPRPGLIHCVVVRGDGSIEDPSKLLGM